MPNLYDDQSVATAKIADSGVTTAKLADANVTFVKLDADSRDIMRAIENLAINPSYENVLPGAHTTAITDLYTSDAVRNLHLPGWQILNGSACLLHITQDTSVYASSGSAAALKVSCVNTNTSYFKVRQIFGSSIGGINQYTQHVVAGLRGRAVTITGRAKMGPTGGGGNDLCMFIYDDVTGYTYGDWHGQNTNWETVSASATIAATATEVHWGWHIRQAPYTYWLDNVMAVAGDQAIAASALNYQPRAPIGLQSPYLGVTSNTVLYDNPPDTNFRRTGLGLTGFTVDCDFNATRPAWANGCKALVYGQGGAAGSYGNIRPSGHASSGQLIGCVTYNTLDCQLHLGVDGQFEFSVGHTNNDLVVQLRQWIGEGL